MTLMCDIPVILPKMTRNGNSARSAGGGTYSAGARTRNAIETLIEGFPIAEIEIEIEISRNGNGDLAGKLALISIPNRSKMHFRPLRSIPESR